MHSSFRKDLWFKPRICLAQAVLHYVLLMTLHGCSLSLFCGGIWVSQALRITTSDSLYCTSVKAASSCSPALPPFHKLPAAYLYSCREKPLFAQTQLSPAHRCSLSLFHGVLLYLPCLYFLGFSFLELRLFQLGQLVLCRCSLIPVVCICPHRLV